MTNIIFLGPPGSGKGTQALILSNKMSIPAISMGDMLRAEVENGSDIGKKVVECLKFGDLVPDEVVTLMVRNRIALDDCKKGFILDGFPRTKNQAVFLDKALKSLKVGIDVVFLFEIDEEVLIKRISGRFYCAECKEMYNTFFKKAIKDNICDKCGSGHFEKREDDKEVIVRGRMRIYNSCMNELRNHYEKKDLIFLVDALKDIDSVSEKLIAYIR